MNRTGLGWTVPITDPVILERCRRLVDSPIVPCPPDPGPSHDGPVRSAAAISAAMASSDPDEALSVTDREIDGTLSAGAMHYAASLEGRPPLPAHPEWLARRGGISEAAKVLYAIVAELGPCRPADVWGRIGNASTPPRRARFLDEARACGLVTLGSDGSLVAARKRGL